MNLKKGYYKPLAEPAEKKTSFSISMKMKNIMKLDKEVLKRGTSRSSFIESLVKSYFEEKEKLYG